MSKEKLTTDAAQAYSRASELVGGINVLMPMFYALKEQITRVSEVAKNAGIYVPGSVEEAGTDLSYIEESMGEMARSAHKIAVDSLQVLKDHDSASVKKYVEGLSPAELVNLIRGVK